MTQRLPPSEPLLSARVIQRRVRRRNFAMWPAFPTSDYYGGSAPSRPDRPTVDPARRSALAARPVAGAGTVPVFTDRRLTKEEPGYTPAASPRLRRRPSPWPPGPAVVTSPEVAHPRVRQARTAPSPDPPGSSWWDILGGFTHRFLAYSFSSCSPDPPPSDGAGHAPALSGPLATLTGTSRIGLPSASPACCDRPAVAVSHPHSNNQRLTAHAPVAPAGILAGHPQDQGAGIGGAMAGRPGRRCG